MIARSVQVTSFEMDVIVCYLLLNVLPGAVSLLQGVLQSIPVLILNMLYVCCMQQPLQIIVLPLGLQVLGMCGLKLQVQLTMTLLVNQALGVCCLKLCLLCDALLVESLALPNLLLGGSELYSSKCVSVPATK